MSSVAAADAVRTNGSEFTGDPRGYDAEPCHASLAMAGEENANAAPVRLFSSPPKMNEEAI
jgi:hypothetical protein